MDQAQEVLLQIETHAEGSGLPIIGSRKGGVLAEIVQEYEPKRILEIGTLVGYSAILLVHYLPKGGEIVTIEKDMDAAEAARKNIKQAGLENKIKVFEGDALEVIPTLGGEFELLFIDAAKDEYLDYLLAAEQKLTSGAVVVADNVKMFEFQLRSYLHYVRESSRYESHTRDLGFDAIEVSVRKASGNPRM